MKSYAWDYFSVPTERLKYEELSEDAYYKDRCMRRCHLWHKLAVWAYNLGFLFVMLGVALLYWAVSKPTSVVVSASMLTALLTSVFGHFKSDASESFAAFLEKRLL